MSHALKILSAKTIEPKYRMQRAVAMAEGVCSLSFKCNFNEAERRVTNDGFYFFS